MILKDEKYKIIKEIKEMERISFLITAKEKTALKIKAIENNTNLSDYIREAIGIKKPQTTKQTPQERINEISDLLAKNGMNMTADERKALKIEREQLKGAIL